jgi:hypothetical protein
MLHTTNVTTRVVGMVTKKIRAKVVNFMKQQCVSLTVGFIIKLEKYFPT